MPGGGPESAGRTGSGVGSSHWRLQILDWRPVIDSHADFLGHPKDWMRDQGLEQRRRHGHIP